MADGAFWNNQERAQAVVQRTKALRGWIEPFDKLWNRMQAALEMDALLDGDPDPGMIAEVAQEAAAIHEDTDAFKLKSLLQGPDDFRDAQVEIAAGAGGTEAQDWAEMLMRIDRKSTRL